MRYFRNTKTNEVFGYDADQGDLISLAVSNPDMVDITAEWPPAVDQDLIAENEVRSKRNILLSQSDWTQVADAPVDQPAWATYRQALRDVPQQAGFPHEVDWPAKP
jgi:hypothetical protein